MVAVGCALKDQYAGDWITTMNTGSALVVKL